MCYKTISKCSYHVNAALGLQWTYRLLFLCVLTEFSLLFEGTFIIIVFCSAGHTLYGLQSIFLPDISAVWLILEFGQFCFIGCLYLCSIQWVQGPVVCSQLVIRCSNEFVTCQKFWSADSGYHTVEEEPQADSPTFLCASVEWQTAHLKTRNGW